MKCKKKTVLPLKPLLALLLIAVMLISATACGNETEASQPLSSSSPESSQAAESAESTAESSEESQPLPWNPEELDYIDGLFAAMIDIPKLDDYYRYEAPESEHSITPIIFIPKSTIYDVKIFSINDDWADISDKKIENILFETEKVTPQKPLIADIKFVDISAVRGISFTDENGKDHFYEITDSAIDGSLIISKFENPETEGSKEE